MLNQLFVALGIESWKPVLSALMLPPVPFLLLVLGGGWAIAARRRRLGWSLLLAGAAGVWLSCCAGAAWWLQRVALPVPPVLSPQQIAELRARVQANRAVAIIVLGGGRESVAPEYGQANLTPTSLARLRYALWLARATQAPVGYSGGIGWAQSDDGDSEAKIAARIAEHEFGLPLRWLEGESRDTRENAARTVALLKRDGIDELVLVSHGWHLPRGLRALRDAAGSSLQITAAPMGVALEVERPVLRWLPSRLGFSQMQFVSHELIGLLAGA